MLYNVKQQVTSEELLGKINYEIDYDLSDASYKQVEKHEKRMADLVKETCNELGVKEEEMIVNTSFDSVEVFGETIEG